MRKLFAVMAAVVISGSWAGCQSSTKTSDSVSDETLESRPFINNPNAPKMLFFLNIVGEETSDSTVVYLARSIFENDTVGLNIEVHKHIPAGIDADGQPDQENGFVEGAIRFASAGVASDNFVKSLQKLYGLHGTGKMTSKAVSPLVFSSNKEAVDLSANKQGTYSFKLFLPGANGPEAEVFAVLDTYRRSFEIAEKDSTYRAALLSAFEAQE